MIAKSLHTVLRWCLALLGMVLVLFEEVLWAWLGALMRQIGRLGPVRRVEDGIRRLPPYVALPLFVTPWIILLPLKLFAVWLIARGEVTRGTMLLFGSEAFSVAILARLYELCRPALQQWPWFVIVESMVLRWSHWAHDLLARLPLVRRTQVLCAMLWHEVGRRAALLMVSAKPRRP